MVGNPLKTQVIVPTDSGENFLSAGELFRVIQNFTLTPQHTLRTVQGVAPYILTAAGARYGYAIGDANILNDTFGRFHGVHHAYFNNVEVLLVHTGRQLWSYQGWSNSWRMLIGPATAPGGPGDIDASLLNDSLSRGPTLFITVDTGVIIIPKESIAYFYDGFKIAPLGFNIIPAAPIGKGPKNSSTKFDPSAAAAGINDDDYAFDALIGNPTSMIKAFMLCRKGTTSALGNADAVYSDPATPDRPDNQTVISGWLESGEWRAKVAFVDHWGNISAWSHASNEVVVSRQVASSFETASQQFASVDRVRKQFAWVIEPGPVGTIGRMLAVTKDLRNSGTADFFYHTQNTGQVNFPFATIPDNETVIYPDNIPDAWLVSVIEEYVPVPRFSIAWLALGSLWIAGIDGSPATIRPSSKGRYGTFPLGKDIHLTTNGAAVTGGVGLAVGMLVFTNTSTIYIGPKQVNRFHEIIVITDKVGCVSHTSIQTLPDGSVIWLSLNGFYKYTQSAGITELSANLAEEIESITPGRMPQAVSVYDPVNNEYICWVSINGSAENNLGFVYDMRGFRLRNECAPVAVCVTQDKQNQILLVGEQGTDHSIWVLNRATTIYDNASYSFVLESGWFILDSERQFAKTVKLQLWLVETSASSFTVELYKGWRKAPTVTHVMPIRYLASDVPNILDTTLLGAAGVRWENARPYWTVVNFDIPASEAVKFRISGTGNFEVIGVRFIGASKNASDSTVRTD